MSVVNEVGISSTRETPRTHVLNELKNRAAVDVLTVVCDGLSGLPDAVNIWAVPAVICMRRDETRGIKHPAEHDQVPPDLRFPSEACRREDPDLRSAP